MAVKFVKPTPAKPETPKAIQCFSHLMPLYPSEAKTLSNDIDTLAKARKHEKKILKAIKKKANNPAAFKKASHLYFSSVRCLQAKMIEVNARLPYQRRWSSHQIIEVSQGCNILKSWMSRSRST